MIWLWTLITSFLFITSLFVSFYNHVSWFGQFVYSENTRVSNDLMSESLVCYAIALLKTEPTILTRLSAGKAITIERILPSGEKIDRVDNKIRQNKYIGHITFGRVGDEITISIALLKDNKHIKETIVRLKYSQSVNQFILIL